MKTFSPLEASFQFHRVFPTLFMNGAVERALTGVYENLMNLWSTRGEDLYSERDAANSES